MSRASRTWPHRQWWSRLRAGAARERDQYRQEHLVYTLSWGTSWQGWACTFARSKGAVKLGIQWLKDRPRDFDFVTDMEDLCGLVQDFLTQVCRCWIQELGRAVLERVDTPTAQQQQQQIQLVVDVDAAHNRVGGPAAADADAGGASGRVNSIQAQSRASFPVDDGGGTSGATPPPPPPPLPDTTATTRMCTGCDRDKVVS